ncbi:MAG: hypothetical protein WKI04_11490 [Ferruginibacter sp.]
MSGITESALLPVVPIMESSPFLPLPNLEQNWHTGSQNITIKRVHNIFEY